MLFLSRLSKAKGVDDLIDGFGSSEASSRVRLVIAGNGPEAEAGGLRELAASRRSQVGSASWTTSATARRPT